ncbi:hypothetical protein ABPG73_003220 [Tetrahymena malaccensis]
MLNIVHEYSEKDFDIVYPKKLQDIEETEGLLFQSRTNSMRKCEISQVNSPILKSQRLNNNVLMSEEKRNILNYQQATLCGKELDDHQLKNQC